MVKRNTKGLLVTCTSSLHTVITHLEEGDEPPGWYQARVLEYFQDGSCKVTYDDSLEITISEIINLHTVDWLPCSCRAKRFVPIDVTPVTAKPKRNPSPKFYQS